MDIETRKKAFIRLGDIVRAFVSQEMNERDPYLGMLNHAVDKANEHNPWFTKSFILNALKSIGSSLKKEHLEAWIARYPELENPMEHPRKIGVVNAGNIPLVGFHDFLSTLMSGHIYYGKLSSKDEYLPQAIARVLIDLEPGFKGKVFFEKEHLKEFDAIIATGSNNTSRYFKYYFGKYPHIIRKNRNGTAVLTGEETTEELRSLADDVFLYFGLGCRNVSKLYVPESFDLSRLLDNMEHYQQVMDYHKYANNYDYNKSVFLMNQTPHLDNGFLLLMEDSQIASPISTLYYERYNKIDQVKENLIESQQKIQCIVTHAEEFREGIEPGQAQNPALWDYADNIDTIRFLLSLTGKS